MHPEKLSFDRAGRNLPPPLVLPLDKNPHRGTRMSTDPHSYAILHPPRYFYVLIISSPFFSPFYLVTKPSPLSHSTVDYTLCYLISFNAILCVTLRRIHLHPSSPLLQITKTLQLATSSVLFNLTKPAGLNQRT